MKSIIDMTDIFDVRTAQYVTRLHDPLLADHLVFGIVDVDAFYYTRPLFTLDEETSASSTLLHVEQEGPDPFVVETLEVIDRWFLERKCSIDLSDRSYKDNPETVAMVGEVVVEHIPV